MRRAARSPPTTSSTSATGWRAGAGTRPTRARPCPTTWSPGPEPATSRPSSGSPGPPSPAISRRMSSPDERRDRRQPVPFRGQHPPQGRDPRPAGPGRRAEPPASRARRDRGGASRSSRGARGRRARRHDGPGARRGACARAPLQPDDRAVRDRGARRHLGRAQRERRVTVRVGVVVFPGSNSDADTAWALARAGAEPVELWHEHADLSGVAAVVLPGGFAYGDSLRAGAIARFSPVMRAVAGYPAAGGLVLGICNGFQVLAEAGLLPGALLRNRSLRFVCRDVTIRAERVDRVLFRYVDDAGSPAGVGDRANPNGSLRAI